MQSEMWWKYLDYQYKNTCSESLCVQIFQIKFKNKQNPPYFHEKNPKVLEKKG